MATERLERLVARLNRMESPDEVADYLRSQGIKGVPYHSGSCPIANLLKRGRKKGRDILVTGASAWLWVNGNPFLGKRFLLSRNVRHFVERFDSGSYPDLTFD